MKKKELLAMKPLLATETMKKTAEENPIRTTTVKHRGVYGSWTSRESKSIYARYFRAVVQDGILKVAMFNQESLQKGEDLPDYEVYCDNENNGYLTYDVKEEKWKTAKIDYLPCPGISYRYESANWQQDKDRKLVNEYFKTGQNRDIYEAVLDFQAAIKKCQLQRKHRTELDAIDETMREVPDIPKGFHEWIVRNCFMETMFYEPDSACRGRWPKMYCTHCKQWMDATSYPNRPEHNKEGKCPKCGVNITYKSWNKQKYVTDETDVGLLQRLKDDSGWIIRSFSCKIRREHKKGWEEYELSVYEDTRARLDETFREREFFEYGEYKYTGIFRWCHEARHSQWGSYYYSKSIGRVVMYTPNLKRELKREAFGKMDLKTVMKGGERERVEPVRILMKLRQHPYVEYLQKSGLNTLTQEIVSNSEDMQLFARDKNRICDVLKLDRQRFRRLVKFDGGSRVLRALQYEQNTGNRITDHNIEFIAENKLNVESVIREVDRTGMNLQRMLNYLEKQMKITGQDYKSLFRHYTDYLDMAAAFGMDITDEIVCRQPQLMKYHDRYLERKNREKNKTRDNTVDKQYPNIKANLQKNRERFGFKTEEFEIVVPATASDITREGRKQHHCVGASDTYIANMNNERYFILFLRRRCDLKTPYYTLEVTWDGEIKQFYAAYDRQPDKEKIQKVLSAFTKAVQKREHDLQKKMHEVELSDNLKATRAGTEYLMITA